LNSWNPVWANFHYYAAMAKDSWHTRSWKDKIKVWIMNPGWRPADAAERFPKKSYDPRVDFKKFDPQRSLSLSAYGLAQFTALVVANSHFLSLLPKQSNALNIAYFGYILISLVCLGGVLENRRPFLIAETGRLILTAVAVAATGGWFGGLRGLAVVIPILAFQALSLLWLGLVARAFQPAAASGSVAGEVLDGDGSWGVLGHQDPSYQVGYEADPGSQR
jgi:hypothetical protein